MTLTDPTAPDAPAAPVPVPAPVNLVPSALARGLTVPKGFGDQSLLSPRPDAIRLLGGIPDPSALPLQELRGALGEVWDAGGAAAARRRAGRTAPLPEETT